MPHHHVVKLSIITRKFPGGPFKFQEISRISRRVFKFQEISKISRSCRHPVYETQPTSRKLFIKSLNFSGGATFLCAMYVSISNFYLCQLRYVLVLFVCLFVCLMPSVCLQDFVFLFFSCFLFNFIGCPCNVFDVIVSP